MTPADLHALKVAALSLADDVRLAQSLPLFSRAAAAMEAARIQTSLNIQMVGALEFILMRLAALENESGGASTNEVQDNGERRSGQG